MSLPGMPEARQTYIAFTPSNPAPTGALPNEPFVVDFHVSAPILLPAESTLTNRTKNCRFIEILLKWIGFRSFATPYPFTRSVRRKGSLLSVRIRYRQTFRTIFVCGDDRAGQAHSLVNL